MSELCRGAPFTAFDVQGERYLPSNSAALQQLWTTSSFIGTESFFQTSAVSTRSRIALPYLLPAKDKGSYLVFLWPLMELGSEWQRWS